MEVMIHACPERMWYVNGFLIPSLEEQGINPKVWNDTEKHGCLISCMESFASCNTDTWHIQDDVLISRDFSEHDSLDGVVYGFCNEYFYDDPDLTGEVYVEDGWHSFQCVRIPCHLARECAEWFFNGDWEKETQDPSLFGLRGTNRGDDSFFREFLLCRHGDITVTNLKPNIVEHVDLLMGGSVLHPYRDYQAVAHYWNDKDLTEKLKAEFREKRLGAWS